MLVVIVVGVVIYGVAAFALRAVTLAEIKGALRREKGAAGRSVRAARADKVPAAMSRNHDQQAPPSIPARSASSPACSRRAACTLATISARW